MPSRIRSFGTERLGRFQIMSTSGDEVMLRRQLWFDQDTEGRWLVWAATPDAVGDLTTELGAIVVEDPIVAAFLEQLSQLVAYPQRFAHEPRFDPAKSRLAAPERRIRAADEPSVESPERDTTRQGSQR